MAHMKHAGDPRFTDKLKKPVVLANKKMALTFIPESPDQPPLRAEIMIDGVKSKDMITKLKTGAVRLQIATGFDERDIVFEDGAEVLFLYEMLDQFIHGLPR